MHKFQRIFLLLALLSGPVSAAQPRGFTFTKILDNSSPMTFVSAGSLNDQGAVAITVHMEGAGYAVLVGDGRTLSSVAETAVGSFGPATIDNRGDVVFAADSREGRRILLSRNGRLSTLVDTGARAAGNPVVNARGTVAFTAFRATGGQSVLALDHGEITEIASHMRAILTLDINERGQVLSMDDPGRPASSRLIVGDGRTTWIVADAAVDLHSGLFLQAAINDRGTVAFSAFLGEEGQRIYLADPRGGLTPVITSDGPFGFLTLAGLTNSGTPVFTASLDAGGRGVFVGPDPIADRVIATGDTLDGLRVTSASAVAVNASGQILLWVTFENGISALYRTQHGAAR